jgi:hypothetical protein
MTVLLLATTQSIGSGNRPWRLRNIDISVSIIAGEYHIRKGNAIFKESALACREIPRQGERELPGDKEIVCGCDCYRIAYFLQGHFTNQITWVKGYASTIYDTRVSSTRADYGNRNIFRLGIWIGRWVWVGGWSGGSSVTRWSTIPRQIDICEGYPSWDQQCEKNCIDDLPSFMSRPPYMGEY